MSDSIMIKHKAKRFLPSQLKPSPLNMSTQRQMNDPIVFSHVALTWQGFSSHSIISSN